MEEGFDPKDATLAANFAGKALASIHLATGLGFAQSRELLIQVLLESRAIDEGKEW